MLISSFHKKCLAIESPLSTLSRHFSFYLFTKSAWQKVSFTFTPFQTLHLFTKIAWELGSQVPTYSAPLHISLGVGPRQIFFWHQEAQEALYISVLTVQLRIGVGSSCSSTPAKRIARSRWGWWTSSGTSSWRGQGWSELNLFVSTVSMVGIWGFKSRLPLPLLSSSSCYRWSPRCPPLPPPNWSNHSWARPIVVLSYQVHALSMARPQASYWGHACPTRSRVWQPISVILKIVHLNATVAGLTDRLNVYALNVVTLMQAQQKLWKQLSITGSSKSPWNNVCFLNDTTVFCTHHT